MKHSQHSKDRAHSKHVHKFSSQEFTYHAKNHYWYLGVGILLVGFLFLTIQAKDYLMSAVVIAVAVAIFRLANLKPDSKDIEVSAKGVYWGDAFIGFHQIKNFWITDVEGKAHVYFDRLGFNPTISFIIPSTKIDTMIELLVHHLPYHPHRNEPISDRINRLLRL